MGMPVWAHRRRLCCGARPARAPEAVCLLRRAQTHGPHAQAHHQAAQHHGHHHHVRAGAADAPHRLRCSRRQESTIDAHSVIPKPSVACSGRVAIAVCIPPYRGDAARESSRRTSDQRAQTTGRLTLALAVSAASRDAPPRSLASGRSALWLERTATLLPRSCPARLRRMAIRVRRVRFASARAPVATGA